MSKYCFLCLSDEGVFLNITPYNYKVLCGEVESYLPVKIEDTRGKQNKVCYKCAYELKQCSDFVRRYKESRTNLEQNLFRKRCCNLCLEPAKRGYIFKLNKDNDSLNNLWSTIEKFFDGNLPQINKAPLICLKCRYILDILFDLTCLCQEMSKLKDKLNKDIDYSAIPKVNTAVIKRKTTTTKFMRLKTYVIHDSDSDSSINKAQSTAEMNKDSQQNLRLCDQCKNSIKHGEDMYRFHRSGLTVCETCRGSIDLNRHGKKKDEQNTKLCTVFLKDVLTDTAVKRQKAYKIEKDSYGNKVYIITESESEVEVEDKAQGSKVSKKIQEKSQTRSKPRMKSDSSDNETKTKKKIKVDEQNTFDSSKLRKLPLRSSTKRAAAQRNHYSDTDILLTESPQKSEKRGAKRRNTSISSASDVETERKSSRKKLRSILEHFIPSKDSNIGDDTSIIQDSTKVENTNENEKKKKTRSSSVSSTNENEKKKKTRSSSVSSTNENEKKRKTRSSSVSSTNGSEYSPTIKHLKRTKLSKTSVKKSQLSEKESLLDKTDVDKTNTDTNEKYICSKCCAVHENKLIAATHELTHFKQLELKLHKINISEKLEDEQQVDGSSEKQLIDELAEQQNEEITLTVNDDEDIETAGITEDTNKQLDKEICISSTENQKENSLQMQVSNKNSIEKTKVTDTIAESFHEESIKTNEHDINTSETTAPSLLISTSVKNGSACSDNIKNDQIQHDSSKSDEVENEQKKMNKLTIDKEKIPGKENIGSTESEKIDLSLEEIDEDESKENENVEDTENESIKLQQNSIEEIEDDITNKAEKDKIVENEDKVEENEDKIEENEDKVKENEDKIVENEDKIVENADKIVENEDKIVENEDKIVENEDKIVENEDKIVENKDKIEEHEDKIQEIEKDKIETTETIEGGQKEQNNDKNVHVDLENFNAGTAKLNNRINIDAIQSNNLSQEKQKIIEDDDNGNNKKETDINTVDNITLKDSIENSLSTSNVKSTEDNCHSGEGENQQVNETSTTHTEKESKHTGDTKALLSNLENTNSSESTKNNEVSLKVKADQESINRATEIVETIFDLAADELDNRQNVMDQNKRYDTTAAETLEDISREIQKSADMPSLEPISSMEVDHKQLV